MAIPFYEPRQQATSECDQVDGHFPPAPSSQAVPLPTANFPSAANTTQTPTNTRSYTVVATTSTSTAMANLSTSTATSTPSIASGAASTPSPVTSSSTTTNTSGSSTPVSPGSSNATTAFTISSNNPNTAASFLTNPTNTETTQTAFSTAAPPSLAEPLPWKLLAVSMCKALKQYYQQTNSPDVFTTAIIEILPSGSPTQSTAAGN